MNRVISAVRNCFRLQGHGLPFRGISASVRQTSGLKPALLASEREDDHRTLQVFLQDTKWSLMRASSWGEIPSFCGSLVSPVVLVDRQFQGSDWRTTFSSLFNPAANRCLILLSDISDPYLWNELVRHGGFDILVRPFDRSEVLRTLAFAHKHCETGWPALQMPQENAASPARRSK